MDYRVLLFGCMVFSVTSRRVCECPIFYDYPFLEDYPIVEYQSPESPEPAKGPSPSTTERRTTMSKLMSTTPPPRTTRRSYPTWPSSPGTSTSRPVPPRINTLPPLVPSPQPVGSRNENDFGSTLQMQSGEIYCLSVLDRLLSVQWQEEIDRISVSDLGNFSTLYKVPEFSNLYSNPESEWVQEEGMPWNKLDKCVRNLVSKVAPRMNQAEILCLNRMYSDYMVKENRTAGLYEKYIRDTSMEQLPFKSFYTYFELTELLFDNKNIDALDDEVRAIHEDMLEFYIKTEEDKSKKIFIVEQECEWKNARALREVNNEDSRYQKFAEQVRHNLNKYIYAEILHKWLPGSIVPKSRYDELNNARQVMEAEIQEKIKDLRKERKDAQFLCTYAAQLANDFFMKQKEIIFRNVEGEAQSSGLKARQKYVYLEGMKGALVGKNDDRESRVNALLQEYKEGYYCLANFMKMIENHHRYAIATVFVGETPSYGYTYCNIKEMSAELVQPRYCRCQGTFCEEFGLATVRAERFQLNLLPNNTYSVSTNSSYRIKPLDELIAAANQRIAGQKFNTWWYRHQKMPTKV